MNMADHLSQSCILLMPLDCFNIKKHIFFNMFKAIASVVSEREFHRFTTFWMKKCLLITSLAYFIA